MLFNIKGNKNNIVHYEGDEYPTWKGVYLDDDVIEGLFGSGDDPEDTTLYIVEDEAIFFNGTLYCSEAGNVVQFFNDGPGTDLDISDVEETLEYHEYLGNSQLQNIIQYQADIEAWKKVGSKEVPRKEAVEAKYDNDEASNPFDIKGSLKSVVPVPIDDSKPVERKVTTVKSKTSDDDFFDQIIKDGKKKK